VTPKGNSLLKNTLCNVQMVTIGPPFFHSSLFYSAPKILCFTVLFNRPVARHPNKCPFPWRRLHLHACNTCSLDTPDSASQAASRSFQPFFPQLTARVPIPYSVR